MFLNDLPHSMRVALADSVASEYYRNPHDMVQAFKAVIKPELHHGIEVIASNQGLFEPSAMIVYANTGDTYDGTVVAVMAPDQDDQWEVFAGSWGDALEELESQGYTFD